MIWRMRCAASVTYQHIYKPLYPPPASTPCSLEFSEKLVLTGLFKIRSQPNYLRFVVVVVIVIMFYCVCVSLAFKFTFNTPEGSH